MRRGHYVIIGGAALFVIGIVITIAWALPIAERFQKESAFLQSAQLEVGESESIRLQVTDTSRPLSVVVSSSSSLGDPDDSHVVGVVVTAPDNETVLDTTSTENTVLSVEPTVLGVYELTITNQGSSATNVNAIFGYLPGVEQNNQVNIGIFSGVLTGVGVVIAGIIAMIVGVVIVVIDRRKEVKKT